jgi:hypothetical protein
MGVQIQNRDGKEKRTQKLPSRSKEILAFHFLLGSMHREKR